MSTLEEMVKEQYEAREEEQWNMPAEDWDASYNWCCEYWQEWTQDEMLSIMEYEHDIDTDDFEDKSFDEIESAYFKIADDTDNENLVNSVAAKARELCNTIYTY